MGDLLDAAKHPFEGMQGGRPNFESITNIDIMAPIFYGLRDLWGQKTLVDYAAINPKFEQSLDTILRLAYPKHAASKCSDEVKDRMHKLQRAHSAAAEAQRVTFSSTAGQTEASHTALQP